MNVRRLTVAMVGAPLLAAFALMAYSTPARAAAPPNITGTWKCCSGGGAGHQRWTITDTSGTLTGHGGFNGVMYPISGSISGSRARIVTGPYKHLPQYTATFKGVVSADDLTIKGTWTDTFGQSGTFTATRVHGPAVAATAPTNPISRGALDAAAARNGGTREARAGDSDRRQARQGG
jgi:hypothetical protein